MKTLKVKSVNNKQSVIEYTLTEIQDKCSIPALMERKPIAQTAEELGIKEELVRNAYIALYSSMYGPAAEGIVNSNF